MTGMIAAGLLLLAAPDKDDEARKMLRVAYASLYEWREDKIANATFAIDCSGERQGLKAEDLLRWKAKATVVIADGRIARVHYEGAPSDRAERIERALEWVLDRFVRKPFDERYEEAKFGGPEERAGGRHAIHLGTDSWIVEKDRLVAQERNIGTDEKPNRIRVDFTTGPMGGGYAILGESAAYGEGAKAVEDARTLTSGQHEGVPVPVRFAHSLKWGVHTETMEIVFSQPRLNAENPVVLDPESRDRVRAAWQQRYRLPAGVRIDGQWNRVPGKATVKGGWQRRAYGDFQLLDGQLEVLVSEKLKVDNRIRDSLRDFGKAHIREALDTVLDVPFEKEFEDCGFRTDETDAAIVHLVGHPNMLAVRIEDGLITGHLENAFGVVDWWEYRLKKARDGRMLIDRRTRRVGDRKWTVRNSYGREGDFHVPKTFEILVAAQPWSRPADGEDVAILEYEFRKIDLVAPDG